MLSEMHIVDRTLCSHAGSIDDFPRTSHGCQVEKNKHFVDFTIRDPEAAAQLTAAPREGEMVNAQITSLSGVYYYQLAQYWVCASQPH